MNSQPPTSMDRMIQIYVTTDQESVARTIAQDLVTRCLAACCQISGPVTSVYRWAGNVETASEWLCTIKTTRRRFLAVQARVAELHTYDEPEIIAVEITNASEGYANWLRAQVAGSEQDEPEAGQGR